MRNLPPCGYPLALGPGGERSWAGREEVSQLLAEMGIGGRSQQNGAQRAEGTGAGKVTKRGNQALEVLYGPQSGGRIQVTNSAMLPPAEAGWPLQVREPGSGRHSPT